jgi:hypothetical protein
MIVWGKLLRWTPQVHRWIRTGALLLAVIGALIGTGISFDLKASDWAAWMQGFGAIGALAFGFWYPEHRIAKQANEHALRHVITLEALGHEVARTLIESASAFAAGTTSKPEIDLQTLEHWRLRYSAVDPYVFNDGDLRKAYSEIGRVILRTGLRMQPGSALSAPEPEVRDNALMIWKQAVKPLQDYRAARGR